ncbi:MAG: hypothetical protein NT124_03500 [Candidatus Dependentiae bacterium]|nr:hypothetical protein [Candidatus Dependentiae bacterium]
MKKISMLFIMALASLSYSFKTSAADEPVTPPDTGVAAAAEGSSNQGWTAGWGTGLARRARDAGNAAGAMAESARNAATPERIETAKTAGQAFAMGLASLATLYGATKVFAKGQELLRLQQNRVAQTNRQIEKLLNMPFMSDPNWSSSFRWILEQLALNGPRKNTRVNEKFVTLINALYRNQSEAQIKEIMNSMGARQSMWAYAGMKAKPFDITEYKNGNTPPGGCLRKACSSKKNKTTGEKEVSTFVFLNSSEFSFFDRNPQQEGNDDEKA